MARQRDDDGAAAVAEEGPRNRTPKRFPIGVAVYLARRRDATSPTASLPSGEWSADQILAHVTIVNATTIAAAYAIASGTNTTYDNRIALDTWTINRVVAPAGGNTGLPGHTQQLRAVRPNHAAAPA